MPHMIRESFQQRSNETSQRELEDKDPQSTFTFSDFLPLISYSGDRNEA